GSPRGPSNRRRRPRRRPARPFRGRRSLTSAVARFPPEGRADGRPSRACEILAGRRGRGRKVEGPSGSPSSVRDLEVGCEIRTGGGFGVSSALGSLGALTRLDRSPVEIDSAGALGEPARRLLASLILFEIAFYVAYRFGMTFTPALPSPIWFP